MAVSRRSRRGCPRWRSMVSCVRVSPTRQGAAVRGAARWSSPASSAWRSGPRSAQGGGVPPERGRSMAAEQVTRSPSTLVRLTRRRDRRSPAADHPHPGRVVRQVQDVDDHRDPAPLRWWPSASMGRTQSVPSMGRGRPSGRAGIRRTPRRRHSAQLGVGGGRLGAACGVRPDKHWLAGRGQLRQRSAESVS